MLKKKNTKRPSDYETLRIRIPPERSVDEIMKDVQKIRTKLNKTINPVEDKIWMQNHVLIEAIRLGLEELRKKTKP